MDYVNDVVKEYPFLKDTKFHVKDNTGKGLLGYLEAWPEDEIGAPEHPRPEEFPLGEAGIELRKDMGDATNTNIAADLFSHIVPEGVALADGLANLLSKEQLHNVRGGSIDYVEKLKEGERNVGINPNYNYKTMEEVQKAADEVATQGLARGVWFNQWPQKAIDDLNLTTEQKDYIDQANMYIRGE